MADGYSCSIHNDCNTTAPVTFLHQPISLQWYALQGICAAAASVAHSITAWGRSCFSFSTYRYCRIAAKHTILYTCSYRHCRADCDAPSSMPVSAGFLQYKRTLEISATAQDLSLKCLQLRALLYQSYLCCCRHDHQLTLAATVQHCRIAARPGLVSVNFQGLLCFLAASYVTL